MLQDNFTPLSPLQNVKKFIRYSWEILSEKQVRRDPSFVKGEYSKIWVSDWKKLEACRTVEEWLYEHPKCPSWWAVRRNGVLGTGIQGNPWACLFIQLGDAIEKYHPNAKSITEYGCGGGSNLFYLKHRFPHLECYGYELTQEGVELARAAAKKFGLDIKFAQRNYLDDKPEFPATELSYTVLSLEQVPNDLHIALKNIHKMTTVASIHIEPILELAPKTPWGYLARAHFKRRNLTMNFMKTVEQMGFMPKVNEPVKDTPSLYLFAQLLILPAQQKRKSSSRRKN
jgi:hypothetical protein